MSELPPLRSGQVQLRPPKMLLELQLLKSHSHCEFIVLTKQVAEKCKKPFLRG
jgi:hypothetical protein